MKPVSESEARDRLVELRDAAAEGDEVVIARGDRATFRPVPVLGDATSADWKAAVEDARTSCRRTMQLSKRLRVESSTRIRSSIDV